MRKAERRGGDKMIRDWQLKQQVPEENIKRLRTLDELLAQCDPKAPRNNEEQEWLDSKPVGGELI